MGLGEGWNQLGGGGWSWVELGKGGWNWVELIARFSNTLCFLSLYDRALVKLGKMFFISLRNLFPFSRK